jgi:pilus assembly protein Flp/PilA
MFHGQKTDRDGAEGLGEIMFSQIKTFLANESAATAIEYALIASLVAVAIIAAVSNVGSKIQHTFNEVSSNLK